MKNYYLLYILLCFSVRILNAQDKPANYVKVKKLPETVINTEHEELAPVISGDGKKLFFVRFMVQFQDGKLVRDSIYGNQDIWMSTRADQNTPWQQAEKLPFPINNRQHNVVCGTNEDGTVLFLTNSYDSTRLGNHFSGMKPGISISKFIPGKGWSYPTPINFNPSLKKKKLAQSGHFYFHYFQDKESKQEFMLVSLHDLKKKQSESYRDEEDIFVFEYDSQNNVCKLIADLGKQINTEVYETAPVLTDGGKTLLFTRHCKDCHKDSKKYAEDSYILEAKMKPQTKHKDKTTKAYWQDNWGKPIELYNEYKVVSKEEYPEEDEEGLNSRNFDAYLVLHNLGRPEGFDYGFFSSARRSSTSSPDAGEEDRKLADIYEFDIVPSYILIIETVDCKTNKPITTSIKLTPPQAEVLEKNNYARYDFTFVGDKKIQGIFSIDVSAQGYKPKLGETFQINKNKIKDTVRICLDSVDVPIPALPMISTVYFEFAKYDKFYSFPADTASLRNPDNQNDQVKVNNIFKSLLDSLNSPHNKEKVLVLIGTADIVDIDKDNSTTNLDFWSKNRTETVFNYLKMYKISQKIEKRFYGDLLKDYKIPTDISDTLQRAHNRRVIISLLDQDELDLIDKLHDEGKYKEMDERLNRIMEEVERLRKSKQINRP